ncbi:hypothetical protein COLO4_02467 [Corchorus olitorius]|uniref:Uncharacterized protein n=1 Tax=Corchorus olitorius TaxID=93759 RepID=A0A1R3L0W9_9ROSI|nr:hypothetical protein COLO4_02467 [Corchorus olitorius]
MGRGKMLATMSLRINDIEDESNSLDHKKKQSLRLITELRLYRLETTRGEKAFSKCEKASTDTTKKSKRQEQLNQY